MEPTRRRVAPSPGPEIGCRILADLIWPEVALLREQWRGREVVPFQTWEQAFIWLRQRETDHWGASSEEAMFFPSTAVATADGRMTAQILVPPDAAKSITRMSKITGWSSPEIFRYILTDRIPRIAWAVQGPLVDVLANGYIDVRLWFFSLGPRTIATMGRHLRRFVRKASSEYRRGRLVGPSHGAGPYGGWDLTVGEGRLLTVMGRDGPPVDHTNRTPATYWVTLAKTYRRRYRDETISAHALRKRWARVRPRAAAFRARGILDAAVRQLLPW